MAMSAGTIVLALVAGLGASGGGSVSTIEKRPFGKLPGGEAVTLYLLKNPGLEVSILDYGGIVVALRAPDREGRMADVVLGYDSLDGYLARDMYFGALIGRYGNRIAGGRFSLNGVQHTLARNNGPNHLHGGERGFHRVLWKAREVPTPDGPGLELTYVSRDGEEGYPGTLTATVTYAVVGDELRIDYAATSDKDTIVNLTSHSYFNLAGQGEGDVLGHELMIEADRFTPVDPTLIPTGELREVEGTPFDFRRPTAIGARIAQDDPQLAHGKGYDHNWVLRAGDGSRRLAARLREPRSGRVMEVLTTEPGLQFYSGNFLDGTVTGKAGKAYPFRSGLCLETQHFPDSPNHPSFPSTVLKPGQRYHTATVYRFTTDAR